MEKPQFSLDRLTPRLMPDVFRVDRRCGLVPIRPDYPATRCHTPSVKSAHRAWWSYNFEPCKVWRYRITCISHDTDYPMKAYCSEEDTRNLRVPLVLLIGLLVARLHLVQLQATGGEIDLRQGTISAKSLTGEAERLTSASGTILVFLAIFHPAQQMAKMGRVMYAAKKLLVLQLPLRNTVKPFCSG